MQAVVIGGSSDIAQACMKSWVGEVHSMQHGDYRRFPWDLLMIASGTLLPIGRFEDMKRVTFQKGIQDNLLVPLSQFHWRLPDRNKNAKVCFFSGPNPYKASPNYSAYAIAKAGLMEAVRTLDAEFEDLTIFALAPGFTRTKIHEVHEVKGRGEGTKMADIVECFQWCLRGSKELVGGRVVNVFSNEWRSLNAA